VTALTNRDRLLALGEELEAVGCAIASEGDPRGHLVDAIGQEIRKVLTL
jgi:hypothetical protein